jgi:hypothetical protein
MMVRFMTVLALAGLTANCATVTRGTTNQIQVVSQPSDADVRTSMGHTCRTPCTLTIDRKSEFMVTIGKDGFKEQQVPVATRVVGAGAAGFAGNILLGGLVGMAADAATGATLEHFPNPVDVTLEALAPVRATNPRARQRRTAPTS